MSEYPWNKKNNTMTWLSSLYNPFKDKPLMVDGNKKSYKPAVKNYCL